MSGFIQRLERRLLPAGFVAGQAALLWISSGQAATAGLGLSAALLSAIIPWRLRLRPWIWWMLCCLLGVAVGVKCALWYYPDSIATWVLPAPWTLGLAEYLLSVQALLLFRQTQHGAAAHVVPALGTACVVCLFNRTVEHDQQRLWFAAAMLLMALAAVLFQASDPLEAVSTGRAAWLRRMLRGGIVLLAMLLGWQISVRATENVGLLRPWSYDFGLAGRAEQETGKYVREATLRSITESKSFHPNREALRVYSSRIPGYLRGRVFDSYGDARWTNRRRTGPAQPGPAQPGQATQGDVHAGQSQAGQAQPSRRAVPPLAAAPPGMSEPRNGQRLFPLDDQARGPWTPMEVWCDPRRGAVFFAPLGAGYVQGSGRYASVTADQVIVGGLTNRDPYTVFLGSGRRKVELPVNERQRLLARPEGLDAQIDQLARQVCAGRRTSLEKIRAVESFFQTNFRYAFGQLEIPSNAEPLSYFLLRRPAAHCEFFASGAIALLRLQGVPCRYVTGYVVEEQDDYGDFWLARNRNAHAWVEAYDDQQRQWVIVEATPGMSAPELGSTEDSQLAALQTTGDGLASFGLNAGMLRGSWAAAAVPMLGVLVVGLLAVGGLLYTRPDLAARLRGHSDPLSVLRKRLRQMDRRLRRRRMARPKSETLHQFAARLQAAAQQRQDPWLGEAAQWYRQYATVRYGPSADLDLAHRLPHIL
ncbi:MAG: transglutaminase domain-containing protein [Pirellulaceae bacterium]|nr:transglutaminase domain-containing protein [Pirellulaceae bacterium]